MKIDQSIFGTLPNGEDAILYTLRNAHGMEISLSTYGATITSIKFPDRNGDVGETVLGFNTLDAYLRDHPFMGTIVGRVANRISNASFSLEGKTYRLTKNSPPHHIHGGPKGLHRKNWKGQIHQSENEVALILDFISFDGEENYPGDLVCTFLCSLNNDNELSLEYYCNCNQPTIVNLTHHEYFNLKDGGQTPAYDHVLKINADRYTPCDETVCPTGEISSVLDSPYNFTDNKSVKDQLILKDGKIEKQKGYDNNYVLSKGEGLKSVADLMDPISGRRLEIFSTKECVQFYTAGHLDGSFSRDGHLFEAYHGICLEPQSFPDAINQNNFPDIILRPGELYNHKTIYKYSTVNNI